VNKTFYGEISAVRDGTIIYLMKPVKEFFVSFPWLGFLAIAGAASFALGGPRLAILCSVLLTFIVVTGYWRQAMTSLYLVAIAVPMALLVAAPIGVCASINKTFDRIVTVVIDTIQTIPTFVYLIPVVMLFGIGEFPALVAIVLYAIAPAIRYTKQGIRSVSKSVVEAAELSGCTRAQRLYYVEVPLALPVIMLGVNQTIMMAFGMLVITALVGTRGLEHDTLVAISKVRPGDGIVAGLGIAFLSILSDRITIAGGNLVRSRLRGEHRVVAA
jgi:glycine betaine/proline transport system permease protein